LLEWLTKIQTFHDVFVSDEPKKKGRKRKEHFYLVDSCTTAGWHDSKTGLDQGSFFFISPDPMTNCIATSSSCITIVQESNKEHYSKKKGSIQFSLHMT
jgi:hypothetical protein